MNTAARRMDELRGREWRELLACGRSTGRSLGAISREEFRRHPALSLGIAALLGVSAIAFFRSRSAKKRKRRWASALMGRAKRAPAREATATGGLVSETLRKAVTAWIVHSLTKPPAAKQP